jgi:hypothetical protein
MKAWVELCSRLARAFGSAVVSVVLWTIWLGLAVVFFFQLYIVTANELAIPDFVLRRIESKLAEAGVRATFSRTSFDPLGRVLMENVRLSLPAFAEPVLTCRSVFVRLNPLFLIVGRVDMREIELHEVTAYVPAMISPSGRPEEIIRNFDATFEPQRRAIVIRNLSANVAGIPVSAHGTVMLAPTADQKGGIEKLGEFVAQKFPTLCRQALAAAEQLEQFDEPALHLQFSPSESGAAAIHVLALARAVRVAKPYAVEATNLRVSTRLLMFSETPASDIEFSVASLHLPGETQIRDLHARLVGRFKADGSQLDLREVVATASSATSGDIDVRALAARIYPRPFPVLETYATASILGAPLALSGETDLEAKSAIVHFDGLISPRVLDVVSKRLSVNVRKYFEFEQLAADHGEVRFGSNWKFEKLTTRVRIPRMISYGIAMQDGRAEIELEPNRLYSPHAFVRVGTNFAQGSYEHEFQSRQYRFLLEGRLRPLDISNWFRDWWKNFFSQVEFPRTPPVANVDVRGSWVDGRQSNVFVFADVPQAIVRGTELDRVRTRLFVRPAFYDGLEMLAMRGQGNAHGRFTYVGNPSTFAWHTLEVGLDSTLDLGVAAQLLGPSIGKTMGAFRLAQPPALKVRGQFAGPDAPGGASEKLRIEARTAGEFRFHDFPLQDVSFIATLDRDEIILDDVEALFAGGVATGHARVWGAGAQRRVGFDFALEDASLGKVASGLGEFFSAQKGEPPSPPGRFVQEKANVRINFSASAEGRYDDHLSYRGTGSAVLRGAEIGEVPLLGSLSELLKFTALRFTEARTNFRIENAKLVFPEVTLRGANSAIDAHGTYALDRRELEFNAKIFPFQESESIIKSVVGAVLTPLSNAFEVKLSGSLAKPQWSLVLGPTNFLRSLSPGTEAPKTEPAAPEKDPKPPTTSSTDAPSTEARAKSGSGS